MNFYKYIYILAISIMISFGLTAQCGIENPNATSVTCIENASYNFELNFTISDGALDSFDVFVNEVFLDRFSSTQLPVTVTDDIYSGYDIDTFKLVDVKTNCSAELTVANPCDCAIFDPKYSKIECEDDSFYILLDLKHLKNSDSLEIGYPNKYFGKFLFEDLPLQIGPFANIDTIYPIYIADVENIFCDLPFDVISGECPECEISNIEMLAYNCDDEYKKDIVFSFDHKNSGILGYDVYINGAKYATNDFKNNEIIDTSTIRDEFELNAIEIECEDTLSIKIVDVEKPDCSFESYFTSFCCDLCEVGKIDIRDEECTSDSTFSFILDFEYAKNRKDSFLLVLDDDSSKYALDILPLRIENYPINAEGIYSARVCLDRGKCCNEIEFEAPDCEYFDCNISGALYSITYDSVSLYWVDITELVRNNTSDSFSIAGNGKKYGVFSYSDFPVKLGEYKCNDSLNLEYVFKDTKVEDCEYVIEPGVVNCPFKVSTNDGYIKENWNIYSDAKNVYIYSDNENFKGASIDIYNMLGTKVFHCDIENGKHYFKENISSIRTGMYILYFSNDNKKIAKKLYFNR